MGLSVQSKRIIKDPQPLAFIGIFAFANINFIVGIELGGTPH
jgi:hypothetical protein